MPDHPSIEGLREAVNEAFARRCARHGDFIACDQRITWALEAQAAYLTEHGVGWFGKGLVRAEEVTMGRHTFDYVNLVRIPEGGG